MGKALTLDALSTNGDGRIIMSNYTEVDALREQIEWAMERIAELERRVSDIEVARTTKSPPNDTAGDRQ